MQLPDILKIRPPVYNLTSPIIAINRHRKRDYLLALLMFHLWLPAFPQKVENKSQFEITFKNKEDREDLIRLRDFLEEKDAEYDNLRWKLEDELQVVTTTDSSVYADYIRQLKTFLEKHKDTGDPFKATDLPNNIRQICMYSAAVDTNIQDGIKSLVYNVNMALGNYEYWQSMIHQKVMITSNLESVSRDRDAAAKAIQRIYNVEKGDQDYKTTISLYYAVIIFLLILISFLFLFKKSTSNIGNDFLNGNGLQFIALFAIIISTILFGILGILEGKELSAILSGIAGFILGKGLSTKPSSGAEDEKVKTQ